MINDLAHRATIEEMITSFERAEKNIRTAFAMIDAAEKSINAVFAPGLHRQIQVSACGTSYRDNFQDADQAVRIMARDAWRILVERLELKRFMSIKRWEKLQYGDLDPRSAEDWAAVPTFNRENALAFAEQHLSSAHDMLTESVVEIFEWLRPHSGTKAANLKTNSQLEVPPKVILSYMVELCRFGSGWSVVYRQQQKLVALENLFNGLAGNGTICKGYQSLIETAICASSGEGETELFTFRACRNGNLHLTFKRLDLLAKFNQIAGGRRLRPAA